MSDAPENEEVGPELPPTLSPGKHEQPIDIAHVDVPPGKSPESMPVNEVSCSVENGHSPFIDPESATVGNLGDEQDLAKVDGGHVESTLAVEVKDEDSKVPLEKSDGLVDTTVSADGPEAIKMVSAAKVEDSEMTESKTGGHDSSVPSVDNEDIGVTNVASADIKADNFGAEPMKIETHQVQTLVPKDKGNLSLKNLFLLEENDEGSESGTEEDQLAFMKELENFFKEKGMEFKPPKFYGEGLNCLKLWRAVTRLGGYEKVTSCKLWRQVGESFKPPKTCTTVSWTFRGFYEKALLDYERDKIHAGELNLSVASPAEPMSVDNQASGSNRARRDAAARAMQGWSSQRILNNGEVSDPIIKDKNVKSLQKREKQLKSLSSLKRKKPANSENAAKPNCTESSSQLNIVVVDIGPPADWVKINVQKSKDCFEVYALVPGLLREEVRVQSDPAGRLVISGEPEQLDNPWGVTPFKKVLNLPARIDPHQTSAVVTLHGQLYVRVPYEQSEP